MFSEIELYNPVDKSKRAFIHTYIDGVRWRFYNGKLLGIVCNPNRAGSIGDRTKELRRLERALYDKLKVGWNPSDPSCRKEGVAVTVFREQMERVDSMGYSLAYARDLSRVMEQFIEYLDKKGMSNILLKQITPAHIEDFLSAFTKSGTYYMNKRRVLSVCFSKLRSLDLTTTNPVIKTSKRKSKIALNESYKPEELKAVLSFLKENYENLYLCALLMYGTLLRPHQEIRQLKRADFSENLDLIILDGYRNKSGSIRTAPVAKYVTDELVKRNMHLLPPTANLFTGTSVPYNCCYFSSMWRHAKKKMTALGIIKPNQTLYSFRHSAAINVFERTQDLNMIQSLFQHSSLNVSMTYLRSIGNGKKYDPKNLPEL